MKLALAAVLVLAAADATGAQNITKACTAIGYICPKTYTPVCGTNGRTYDTECDLKSVQCETDGLQVKATGPCYTCKTTACPATRDPVCGSDRKTYDNECALVLAKCNGVDVAREYFGTCANATGSGSSDGLVTINCATLTCTTRSQDATGAVCGSDNKTYDDDCALRRAMCATKSLRKAYDGACPNATTGAPNSSTASPAPSSTSAPPSAAGSTGSAAAPSASSLVAALATAVVAVALAAN